jgi:AraC-like DNA-binding protein
VVTRFRVSSTLARTLEELGVAPADVLRRAGLPPALFEQDKIVVGTDELFALYRGIAEASPDPAIGLRLGAEERVERYDPIRMAAVSARSLRDALERLARYKQLTCPEAITVTERAGECRVQFRWLLAQDTEPRMLVDVCFAAVAALARRGSGASVTPKRLELRGAPRDREVYEAHFGCPAKFGAAHNLIVVARADLDRPFLTHNADLFASVAPQLEAELAQALTSKAVGEQVKAVLKRLLAGSRRGIEDVARELGLSSRTLQRRLADQGMTFQQLVQEARRELGAPLPAARLSRAQPDRLSAGVRGRTLLLPRVPPVGGHPARPVARPPCRVAAPASRRAGGVSVSYRRLLVPPPGRTYPIVSGDRHPCV